MLVFFFGHSVCHLELLQLGIEPMALQWKQRILTTEPAGKPQFFMLILEELKLFLLVFHLLF